MALAGHPVGDHFIYHQVIAITGQPQRDGTERLRHAPGVDYRQGGYTRQHRQIRTGWRAVE